MSRHTSGIYLPLELGAMLDLLQVNLLASGASLVLPRATKLGEVNLSRLMGLPFAFRAKNGEWCDWHFGVSDFICESLPSMVECADSTPTKSIEHVCVSL